MEVSDEVVKAKLLKCAEHTIPTGLRTVAEVTDLGHLELQVRDGLFIRVVDSASDDGHNRSPFNDDLQGWVSDHHFLHVNCLLSDDTLGRRLDDIVERVLGPVEERTGNPPESSTDPIRGIALEHVLWHVALNPGNKQGKRCYSMGYTLEGPRSLAHPTRTMKHRPDIDPIEDMHVELLQTATEYGGAAMRLAPKSRTDLIESIGRAKNVPPLGHSNNRNYWTGFQMNVSRPVLCRNPNSLTEDLGRAGDAHPDANDDLGSFTTMIVLTDPPYDYTPAFFFLLEFGVFIEMKRYRSIAFSGLRLHGRAPSTAPPTATRIPDNVYSVTAVLYHRADMANIMKSRISLFPPPIEKRTAIDLGVQALPPEAWRHELDDYVADPLHPISMMTDGHMFMDYLNKFSPTYVYDWNPDSLATNVRVKRRASDMEVLLDYDDQDEDERAQAVIQWERLISHQRLLLGGTSAVKGPIPSRSHNRVKLDFISRAPQVLGNLQSARESRPKKRTLLQCEVVIEVLPGWIGDAMNWPTGRQHKSLERGHPEPAGEASSSRHAVDSMSTMDPIQETNQEDISEEASVREATASESEGSEYEEPGDKRKR
ncbi:hypothetical protein OE88DRAFT_1733261 [Heliocybe sulcata]|uniref:Uncharacterized protein n=1 Tax=Heliocybe sulcata TaxID=5364 RepID=A0A5C3N6J9_9AGAM|nr:hypothetical protein OE88DRAFT_1733261 [Heliocybe sulcata]